MATELIGTDHVRTGRHRNGALIRPLKNTVLA